MRLVDFECKKFSNQAPGLGEFAMEQGAKSAAIQIVRYGELEPCFDAFIDTRTPGSDKKENFTIIGPGVSENPNQHVHIAMPHGFNIGGARQPPGCVNSQHSHDTAEFFYVHTGSWSFNLGEKGEDASVILHPGDAISIPTHVFRGFTNVGEDIGFLFAVLGGDDPGRVTWAPDVFDMAEEYGLVLLESGMLIDTANGETLTGDMEPMPRTTREQVEALERLDSEALRSCCVLASDDIPGTDEGGVQRRRIVQKDGKLSWPHEFAVEELRLEPGARLELGGEPRNQVVFAQSGEIEIDANDKAILRKGDTATIEPGTARTLANQSGEPAIAVLVTASGLAKVG
jgi:quercetin dioxygenase-like cupin family protein